MFIDIPILIQARTGSKRFPQKILANYKGHSILWNVYKQCTLVSNNVIIIGHKQDRALFEHCAEHGLLSLPVDVPENDLIGRYSTACNLLKSQKGIIRVTADCPAIFPQEILWVAMTALKGEYDFVANDWPNTRTTPDGVDCEFYSAKLLNWMNHNVKNEEYREHVPLYLYHEYSLDTRLDIFKFCETSWPVNMKKLKFSIDTKEDLEKLRYARILE
jgi:spore coat polysaccharide biosynthesis protein SpsF